MRERGFSLVETVVVLAVIGIVLGISTLMFGELQRRYGTEAQTRMIRFELLQARSEALSLRRPTRVHLHADRFEVYSTSEDGNGVAPVLTRQLVYPIYWNKGTYVEFDAQGLTTNTGSLCIDDGGSTGAVDSVVIATTRVSLGKKNGLKKECISDNIDIP